MARVVAAMTIQQFATFIPPHITRNGAAQAHFDRYMETLQA